MDQITLRRLLFSKRLFNHGAQHSNKNTELDRFLAIHNFDNAIELFLKIVAIQEGIIKTVKEDWKLKDLWGEINNKLKLKISGYELPLKDQIFTLHETRNLAQHQGDPPSFETVVKYQGYTKDFLNKCFKDVFKIDFNKVFAASLVENIKIKEALVESEKYIAEENFKMAMGSSAKAFKYLESSEHEDFLGSKLRRFILFGGLLDEKHNTRFSNSFDPMERKIDNRINKSLDEIDSRLNERARKINEFANTVVQEFSIIKLGVDYKEYRHFDKITPFVSFTGEDYNVHFPDREEKYYTEEKALFSYEFVLEAALRLQGLTAK